MDYIIYNGLWIKNILIIILNIEILEILQILVDNHDRVYQQERNYRVI